MSLHKEIKGIKVFLNSSEPTYDGYFTPIYFYNGTPQRLTVVSTNYLNYEIAHLPYGRFLESECSIITHKRLSVFNRRSTYV